jgi:hypothetical protein
MRPTDERRHERDPEREAKTAAEQLVDEFGEAQADPEHRRRTERRRGEAGDATTPNQQAQEQAADED